MIGNLQTEADLKRFGDQYWTQIRPAGPVAEPWHVVGADGEPAFQSGFANFGGSAASASFYRHASRVYLQGLVRRATSGSILTIFTLPAGYRPAADLVVPAMHNDTISRVYINSDGTVDVGAYTGNTYLSLDGLSFRVA